MKELLPFAEPLVGSLVSGLIWILVLYVFKIPRLLKEHGALLASLNVSIENLKDSVDHLHARQSVADRLLSDIVDVSIDTETIAKDLTKYPKIKPNKREC